METEEQATHLENKAFQEHQMKKDMDAGQDGAKDVDAMYQFKNTIYIYVDNVSEKLQCL